MCSNFDSLQHAEYFFKTYGQTIPAVIQKSKKNKRPTDTVLVIKEGYSICEHTWGFQFDWSKGPLINIRSETFLQKPLFDFCKQARCIIPAQCWYEWRKDEDGKHKNKIQLPNESPLSFAGVYSNDRFAIMTTRSSQKVADIHARMPVILSDHEINDWLDASLKTEELTKFFNPKEDLDLEFTEDTIENKQMRLF
jgi:putative SOS response-associated peptidase YedK